jgi:CheY-like chemotaxis protein
MEMKTDILIVDDEEIVRRMLASFFQPHFNARTAVDAFEALELLFGIPAAKFPTEFYALEQFLKNQVRMGERFKDQAPRLKFNPELVIADIKMPHINGFQLIHLIRPFLVSVPVFLITGYDVKLNEQEMKRLNIIEILTKPFSPSILLEKVRKILAI